MIQSKFLICEDSPCKAFYNLLWAGNKVLKVSGVTYPLGKVKDRKMFSFNDSDEAGKFFSKKLREKLHGKNRKRIYEVTDFAFGRPGVPLGTVSFTIS